MRATLLHLDGALHAQSKLVERAGSRVLDVMNLGPALRLWTRPPALDALRNRLRDMPLVVGRPDVVYCGSGDFHHVTLALLERALETSNRPVTVLHFDNHPDWVKFSNGAHCGSWAAQSARLPRVARHIIIGTCSRDIERPRSKGADLRVVEDQRIELYPYRASDGQSEIKLCGRTFPTIESLGPSAFAALLLTRIPTSDVYITIDKDMLAQTDAITNWDQGAIRLNDLLHLLAAIADRHAIIGADIVGDWSTPIYGDGITSALIKRGEAMLDQPWRQPDAMAARGVNENANLRLLDFFASAA